MANSVTFEATNHKEEILLPYPKTGTAIQVAKIQ